MMVKDCPIHGHFEDVMAIDTGVLQAPRGVFPGSDMRAHNDEKLHNHGSSTIKYGRGSVLTVDLTNRCNMMCDPCFMDANQVGFVHELGVGGHQDRCSTTRSRSSRRRQMSVQFSGGEPTLSPYFLDAVRYSRQGRLQLACRRRPTASSSPRARSSPRRRPRPGCATRIFSSTASATPPTRIGSSATCSTSSCGPSRTSGAPASTSCR